jgi:peptidoglycan/xylan/chitin deacetylase (PgdA/CDA1 family)
VTDLPRLSRRTFLVGGVMSVAAAASASACGGKHTGSVAVGDASETSTTAADGSTAPASAGTATGPPALVAGETAVFIVRGPTDRGQVALTFHTDGDLTIAQRLLDVLAQRRVVATMFVVGEWLDAHPDFAARIAAGGHEFANHTYTHPTFTKLTRTAMVDEVRRCHDTLVRLTGSCGTFFRPSGTDDGIEAPPASVQDAAAAVGYPVVLGFDVDPLDYRDPGAGAISDRVLRVVQPGSIVSLHFGHAGTVDALPALLDGLAARNLAPVTVSRLFGYA